MLIHRGHVPVPEDHLRAAGLGQSGVVHIHHAAVVAVLLQTQEVALSHFGRAAVDGANVIARGFGAEQKALWDHGQAVGHLSGQYCLHALEGGHLCHLISVLSANGRRQNGARVHRKGIFSVDSTQESRRSSPHNMPLCQNHYRDCSAAKAICYHTSHKNGIDSRWGAGGKIPPCASGTTVLS